jgi:transcriptional regulator GlxA family with amidase domain
MTTYALAEASTERILTSVPLDLSEGAQAAVLRQAVQFIEENAHRPIGIADIAAACHRGPRALQLAFRRGAGTTPWAYVRSVRLHRARWDLLKGDSSSETVFSVAHRWGFTNRSRFSAEYRAAYGEAPGATLRRPWSEPSAA